MPRSFAAPVVVTVEFAKFLTVAAAAALLWPFAAVEAVFVVVLVVVVVEGVAGMLALLLLLVELVLDVSELTADCWLFGSAFEAVALDTGPLLVAMISGAYAAAPLNWSVV
jgi:hypothetical protein